MAQSVNGESDEGEEELGAMMPEHNLRRKFLQDDKFCKSFTVPLNYKS